MPPGRATASSSASSLTVRPALLLHPFVLISTVLRALWEAWYLTTQWLIALAFAPRHPPADCKTRKSRGHVAVIGAGLTGISSAAHFIAHGFEVTLFDSSPDIGGVWSRVNKTSSLQLNSFLYRFHPSIRWRNAYPHRDEILSQVREIWKEYRLEERTVLGVKVERVERAPGFPSPEAGERGHARWIVNPPKSFAHAAKKEGRRQDYFHGPFDAVLVAVGTCGEPSMKDLPGQDKFKGEIIHSTELDHLENGKLENDKEKDADRKKIVVIGGGASAVECADTILARWEEKEVGAKKESKRAKAHPDIMVVVRSDKWIIPRNFVIDTLLAMQPFGRETPFSFIIEAALRNLHYRDLKDLSPASKGIFTGTPIVNNTFLAAIRHGEVEYVRGDVQTLKARSVVVNRRARGTKPGDDPVEQVELPADVVVQATGFKKPSFDILPDDLFPSGAQGSYERPNLYMQNFSVADWSVLTTNSSYDAAIGTVGHFHIGIYARILLVFLLDPATRPTPKEEMLWVDMLRWLKQGSPAGPLSFFTYMEMSIWLAGFHILNFARLRWIFFVLFGWGVGWLKDERGREPERVPAVVDRNGEKD